jgi:ribosomal protein S18 acetylase RimI-like enzyme
MVDPLPAKMNIEFRKAVVPNEFRSLVAFDHKAFSQHPSDWFTRRDWDECESWWLLVGGRKVGCCAFALHTDLAKDFKKKDPPSRTSLYVVTTGILPGFRRSGFGSLFKAWQICYARHHEFTRIVTNCRAGNKSMILLNRKFGFKIVRTMPNYYEDPPEPTVIMELNLGRAKAQ